MFGNLKRADVMRAWVVAVFLGLWDVALISIGLASAHCVAGADVGVGRSCHRFGSSWVDSSELRRFPNRSTRTLLLVFWFGSWAFTSASKSYLLRRWCFGVLVSLAGKLWFFLCLPTSVCNETHSDQPHRIKLNYITIINIFSRICCQHLTLFAKSLVILHLRMEISISCNLFTTNRKFLIKCGGEQKRSFDVIETW